MFYTIHSTSTKYFKQVFLSQHGIYLPQCKAQKLFFFFFFKLQRGYLLIPAL